MLQILYSILIRLCLPFILLRLWWRGRRAPGLRQDWWHRLGYAPRLDGRVVWVHAVSVGETIAAGPVVRRLLERDDGTTVLMTATTDTGMAQARRMFGDQVRYAYAPYDTPGAVRRFLARVRPAVLVILETEIWPNMILQCRQRQVPVLLINARLSERSARGYERVGRLAKPVLQSIDWVAAQAEADAERFRRIGVPPGRVSVTGTIKFDVDIPEAVRHAAQDLKAQIGQRPVWIGGSTHAGEDGQLLFAHEQLLAQHPDALLILVPRHPDRFETVATKVAAHGLSLARRSLAQPPVTAQVYLGDTMGELMALYGASDVAFVGGSLVPRGGHNPLEPAAWGVPVLSGPHVFNFETVYHTLEAGGGVRVVSDADALAGVLLDWFGHRKVREQVGQHARQVVDHNRGALAQVVKGIVGRL